jgi:hypothetical protein
VKSWWPWKPSDWQRNQLTIQVVYSKITFFSTMMLYKSWGFSSEVLSAIFQKKFEKIHQKYRRLPP